MQRCQSQLCPFIAGTSMSGDMARGFLLVSLCSATLLLLLIPPFTHPLLTQPILRDFDHSDIHRKGPLLGAKHASRVPKVSNAAGCKARLSCAKGLKCCWLFPPPPLPDYTVVNTAIASNVPVSQNVHNQGSSQQPLPSAGDQPHLHWFSVIGNRPRIVKLIPIRFTQHNPFSFWPGQCWDLLSL